LKIITAIISVLAICSSSYGQLNKLKGVWISSTSNAIKIESEDHANQFGNSILSNLKANIYCDAIINKDTLIFNHIYYSFLNYKPITHADRYNFIILSLNDSAIILRPCSNFSKLFFDNRSTLKFVRQQNAIDTSIQFSKLFFHTSSCLGNCPVYHLEIDSNKQVKLFTEQVFIFDSNGVQIQDTTKQGYFSGILNDTSYNKLIKEIQSCNLKTLTLKKIEGRDGSTITIIVYFNSERKYFQSMFPPEILDSLIHTLSKICESNNFHKTNEKFELEQ
jgi:uncharacterized protein DUF6438